MSKTVVKVEHVNAFVASTMETFTKMVGVPAKPGKITLKKDAKYDYDISGMIGLSGDAKGMVSLCFTKAAALKVSNKFAGADNRELNGEVCDCIGELANIVVGNAKKGLEGFNVSISLPTVIQGNNHQIMEPKEVYSFTIPFETELGSFHLIVCLKAAES